MRSAPPRFLRLASHPLRWALLSELSRGDLRVNELCVRSGERQSLVSYHLRQLRDGGLVSARRSSADGRDTYYVLDLARCGELLSAVGVALHPALAAPEPNRRPAEADVLFLCTGNSSRSQMAAALCAQLSAGAVRALSAGSQPKPVHPHAVRAMGERGLDISANRSTHLDELSDRRFDYVISLCDRVREVCPEFPGEPETVHWSIADPAREGTRAAYERVATELEQRIAFFIRAINSRQAGGIQHA